MATIKDVAQRAGVSVTTVSRVLNNTAPVNEKTKEKIKKAMKELNYTPSIIAQGMRTKKSRTLGVIIPDYINPFYHELFKYLEDAARKEGYHVIVASTGEEAADEVGYINQLVNKNIDGIIVCSYRGEQQTIEYLLKLSREIPVIFMDNLQVKKPINAVYTDGYLGIREIMKHVIEQGHRAIAFIKPLARYHVANDRYEGYKDAMKEAGLGINKEFVYEGNYHIESGYAAAKYFLTQTKNRPTAIVSATDLMAIGAINYLQSQGIRIPEDIVVAGFDDIYIDKLISPPLTTYKQPIEEIAQKAVKLFIHKSNHPTAKNREIVLKGRVVIRRSTDSSKPEVELIENRKR